MLLYIKDPKLGAIVVCLDAIVDLESSRVQSTISRNSHEMKQMREERANRRILGMLSFTVCTYGTVLDYNKIFQYSVTAKNIIVHIFES